MLSLLAVKSRCWLLLCCLGVCLFASPVEAKRKHPSDPPPGSALATPAPEPPALPTEAAPTVNPAAAPSTSLQPFLDTHLGKILVPLGESAFTQTEVIASLKAGYADGMAMAPAERKPAFQLAQRICDAFNAAIAERQNAVAALRGALATRSSEAAQPRGGAADGTAKTQASDDFFLGSQKNAWTQRAEILRKDIAALYLREREVERQSGAWAAPLPPVAPVPNVAATPAVAAPGPPGGVDPVAGHWLWAGTMHVDLGAGSDCKGDRHGTWHYLSTTTEGRNYVFKWKHGEDFVVLSADGKALDGKNLDGKVVFARRQ